MTDTALRLFCRLTWALPLLLCSSLTGGALAAEVYKVVDEDGNVTYTDTPPKDGTAEKMDLPEVNTQPRTRIRYRPPDSEPDDDAPSDYQLRISYPPDEFHVNPGMRDLSIQVVVDPPVHDSHTLQITDNGEVIEGTTMENIVVRGTHSIRARVVDQQGRIISESDPIQIYVHRPTVNRP